VTRHARGSRARGHETAMAGKVSPPSFDTSCQHDKPPAAADSSQERTGSWPHDRGGAMRTSVISYAREDAAAVRELTQHLPKLGYRVFVDSDLRGSEVWWSRILEQIAACDVLVAVVSRHSLNSTACRREREYAAALGKPLLPVAVEPLTQALPGELSLRQVVDYSRPSETSAFALAGALATLPQPAPLPRPMPPAPPPPLSYLTALVDALDSQNRLADEEQWRIVGQLESGLRSADAEERRGVVDVLYKLGARSDLVVPVFQRVQAIQASIVPAGGAGPGIGYQGASAGRPPGSAAPPATTAFRGQAAPGAPPPASVPPRTAPRRGAGRKIVLVLAGIGSLVVLLLALATCAALSSGGSCYQDVYGSVYC